MDPITQQAKDRICDFFINKSDPIFTYELFHVLLQENDSMPEEERIQAPHFLLAIKNLLQESTIERIHTGQIQMKPDILKKLQQA